jgi:alpha-amylase/alpha-mannosidase (GH57 family)
VNLVPSLLVQLLRYTDHGGSDRHLDVARVPADGLSERDVLLLLDGFFMANLETAIRPHARYHELFEKRNRAHDRASRAANRFTVADLRDLQVWHNLAWIHEIAFEDDPALADFRRKGRDYTEADKQWLLEKQFEILRKIIPLHKKLQDGGQIELTTTPFYHPILPLLWDKRSTHEALPQCPLPRHLEGYPEDVRRHLASAVAFHEKLFGSKPRGLWPSEGSVSQAILGAVAEQGIGWLATDEEILAASIAGGLHRDEHNRIREPEKLYRPWRVGENGRELQIVFRDHVLSDLIGFHYQWSDPHQAAADLVERCKQIGRAAAGRTSGSGSERPALVPIILDGENCWEYYRGGGVEFLRSLYRRLADDPEVEPVRMRDHLDRHPATDRIERLAAGSWISHNFWVWIGHEEENTAWDLLHEARAFLKSRIEEGRTAPEDLAAAQRELDIAEGSDWFWWYGDDHYSDQDDVFDALFRRHLTNVYLELGAEPPAALHRPFSRSSSHPLYLDPESQIAVTVDGVAGFYEWIHAGRYISRSERGTMTLVTQGVVREVYFGLGDGNFYLRLDTVDGAAGELRELDGVRLLFREPAGTEIHIGGLAGPSPTATLLRDGLPATGSELRLAVDQVLELAVPLAALGVHGGSRLQFSLECDRQGVSVDRAPHESFIELTVP